MYIKANNIKLMTFCNQYKKMYVVYKITNPIGQVYIGVTSNLYKRLFQHSNSVKYEVNKNSGLMRDSVLKYGWDNHQVEVVWCSESATEKDAFEVEMNMIIKHKSHYIDNFGIGLNKRRGHHDNSHLKYSKHCIPVYQYDMVTGKLIAEYKSSNEAARALNKPKYGVTCISDARMGRTRFAFGYYWSSTKVEIYVPPIEGKIKNNCKIVKMDGSASTILDVYNTVREAAKRNKMSVSDMIKALENMETFQKFTYIKCS